MRNKHNPNRRRKQSPKPVTNYCKVHNGPWKFETTEKGIKRTCICGWSVTEIARVVTHDKSPFRGVRQKEGKRKHRLSA